MPFKSKKQEVYLRLNEPEVYQDWKEKYGSFKEAQEFEASRFSRWEKRQSERRPPMFLHPSENYWGIYEDEGERKALFIANRITQYMNEVLFEAFTRLDEASKEKTPKQMKSMAQRQANLVWKKMQNYMERYASMGASDSGTELRMVSFINQFFHEKGYENVNVDRYKLRYGRGWGAEEFEAERIRYDYTVHREPKGTEMGTDGKRIPNPRGGRFTSASDNRDAEEFAAYVSTDTTRRVRGELKRAFPNMKFSVSKKDGTLRVAIMQGDLDFRDLWEDVPYDKQYWRRWNDPKPHFDGYVDINTYHTDSYNPKYTSVFNEIVDIMKGDEWFDNSDAQIDYFHTAYYLSLTIGKRDRDYIYTGVPRMSDLFRRAETFEAEIKMHPDWCSNCGMKDDGCINLGYGDWYCMNFLNNRETYDGRYDRFGGETFEARDCVDIVSNFVEPSRNYYRVRFRNPKIFVGGKYTTPQWGQRAAMTIGKKYYGVSGCKITMAQPMGGRWVIQNVLIPKQGGVEMDEELALKIANHIQDRIEREGKWASVICRDRGSTRYVSRINNQHIVRDERGRFAPHAAEEFGAEGGEPIYVVKRDYTGVETDYLIGTESYIRDEMDLAISIGSRELGIDYQNVSLEEIFDTVFDAYESDEYGSELVGKFTDGMYLRLKSYDGDKDVGVLEMMDGGEYRKPQTLDYTFDLSRLGFKHESNAEEFGAEYRQYEVVSFDEINKYRDTLSMHDTLEGAKAEAQKQSETIHSPIYVYEYRIDDDDYETVAKWMKHEGKLVHYIDKYEAEEFGAEGGEPIYVVRRDYTGAETDYLIGTEEYIRRELAEPIDITADEGDIDYEGMSLEEIFDTVFEYSDEYGPDLVGKFTDGMYLRLKSYDGDKDIGVLEMFDGGTIDYTFDLSRLGFKHESNAEEFGAEGNERKFYPQQGQPYPLFNDLECIESPQGESKWLIIDEDGVRYSMSYVEGAVEIKPRKRYVFQDGRYTIVFEDDLTDGMVYSDEWDYVEEDEEYYKNYGKPITRQEGERVKEMLRKNNIPFYDGNSFDFKVRQGGKSPYHADYILFFNRNEDNTEWHKYFTPRSYYSQYGDDWWVHYDNDIDMSSQEKLRKTYEYIAQMKDGEEELSRFMLSLQNDSENFGAEGYIDDGLIWEMRDRLEPPAQGYVMFASSSPEVNIPYLLDKGYDRDEIIIVEYGGNETIWIPNTPPLKRAEEFGADGR